jgi:hypothetical protein
LVLSSRSLSQLSSAEKMPAIQSPETKRKTAQAIGSKTMA